MSRSKRQTACRLPGYFALALCLFVKGSLAMELQGHRGARGVLPENTLAGFQHAIERGMDCLELDIAMTRDRQIIITHDPALNPDLTRKAGRWIEMRTPIKDLTVAELKQYDVGRLKPGTGYAGRFPEQRAVDGLAMPLLAELFELPAVKSHATLCLDIEIKTTPVDADITFAPEEIAEAVVATIDSAGLRGRSRVRSFDWRGLAHVRRIAPDIPTVYLTAARRWLNNLETNQSGKSAWLAGLDIDDFGGSPPRAIKHLGGTFWAPYFRDLTAADLDVARKLGIKVIVWTVNEAADIRRMVEMGVDGITTDYPARARRIVDE